MENDSTKNKQLFDAVGSGAAKFAKLSENDLKKMEVTSNNTFMECYDKLRKYLENFGLAHLIRKGHDRHYLDEKAMALLAEEAKNKTEIGRAHV